MVDRIGGWSVTASKTGNPAVAEKVAQVNKQHVIYGISCSFSAAPSAPVLVQLINPDVSPNTVLWQDYIAVGNAYEKLFLAGICMPIGASASLVLGANGSLVGLASMHGNTR